MKVLDDVEAFTFGCTYNHLLPLGWKHLNYVRHDRESRTLETGYRSPKGAEFIVQFAYGRCDDVIAAVVEFRALVHARIYEFGEN